MRVLHSAGTEPFPARLRRSCRLFTEIWKQSFCSSHPQGNAGTSLPWVNAVQTPTLCSDQYAGVPALTLLISIYLMQDFKKKWFQKDFTMHCKPPNHYHFHPLYFHILKTIQKIFLSSFPSPFLESHLVNIFLTLKHQTKVYHID